MAKTLMQPEEALVYILQTNADVHAVIADRIYPSQAGYKATYPLVTYERADSEYFDNADGLAYDGLADVSIKIEIFGKGYEAAKAAATIIRDMLNAYRKTDLESGTKRLTLNRIRLMDERDGFVNPTDGRTDGIHSVIQEYDFWFLNV